MHFLEGGSSNRGGSLLSRSFMAILMAFLTACLMVVFVASSSAGAGEDEDNDDECRIEAEDENDDGDVDEDETQECGGEVFGAGGNDGNPGATPSGNSHQLMANGLALHWTHQSGQERKIIIRDSTNDTWTNKLPNVLSDWGQSSEFRFVKQQAATDSTSRLNCTMPTDYGRVKVCNHGSYTFTGAGRYTIKFNSEGHIQRGRVRLKNSVVDADRRPLMCQEIGHTLGLEHRMTTASCMWKNASEAADTPDTHDYEQLFNQTHSHGGESETGGVNSNLDVGGGVLDGCSQFTCFDVEGEGRTGYTVTGTILWVPARPPLYLFKLI